MGFKIKGTGLLQAHGRAEFPVGTIQTLNNGNTVRYAELSTTESVLPAQGSPLAWRASGNYDKVTTDLSRARDDLVCGVEYASGRSSSLPFGWMLVRGNPQLDGVTLKTDGTVAIDQTLHMNADKVWDGIAKGSSVSGFGVSSLADSGSQLVSCFITGYLAG